MNPDAVIVIKSTVPVGYTVSLMEKYHTDRILFSPEFCGKGMHCMTICILPGSLWEQTQSPLKWRSMQDGLQSFCVRVQKQEIPIRIMDPTEAEAVKLFANTYLALRVSF